MQAAGRSTRVLAEAGLDVHVHVLESRVEGEVAALDLAQDGLEPLDERAHIALGDDPLAPEHAGVRQRALDVVARQCAVEVHRCAEALDRRVGALAEATTPELLAAGHTR